MGTPEYNENTKTKAEDHARSASSLAPDTAKDPIDDDDVAPAPLSQEVQSKTLKLSTVVDNIRFMRELVSFPSSFEFEYIRRELNADELPNKVSAGRNGEKKDKSFSSSTAQGVPNISLVSHVEEVPSFGKSGKHSPNQSSPHLDQAKHKAKDSSKKMGGSPSGKDASGKKYSGSYENDVGQKVSGQVQGDKEKRSKAGAQSSSAQSATEFEDESATDPSSSNKIRMKGAAKANKSTGSPNVEEEWNMPVDGKKHSSKVHEEEDDLSVSINYDLDQNELKKKKHKDRESRQSTKKSKRKTHDLDKNLDDAIPMQLGGNENEEKEEGGNGDASKQIEFGSLTRNSLLHGMNARLMNEDLFTMGSYNTTGKEVSFLESMSEEERRTRNRHIPEVKGFRRLHRHEIKRDVKVLRNQEPLPWLAADEGLAADLAAASEGLGDDQSYTAADMEREKDLAGATLFDNLTVSDESPFVSHIPFDVAPTRNTDGGADAYGQNGMATTFRESATINIRYPNQVQNVLAFDPPRDDVIQQGSEAYSERKKHRIASLEQHPYNIGLSLNKFQSTVRETRFEWQNAELERERVEEVGATLRNHLLQQAKALRDECIIVSQQVASCQRQCFLEADVSTGRSRRREHNNDHTMLGVLSVLRNRGEKISSVLQQTESQSKMTVSFLLPGETVNTPFGMGVVKEIHESNISSSTHSVPEKDSFLVAQPRKAVVQLDFGVAHLSCRDLRPISKEKEGGSLPDVALVKRWKGMLKMIERGTYSESHNDIVNLPSNEGYSQPPNDAAPFNRTLLDAVIEADGRKRAKIEDPKLNEQRTTQSINENEALHSRTIPFQGGLLPTGGEGSENAIADFGLIPIQAELDRVTQDSSRGVLGRDDNLAIPAHIRQWEKERHELYRLKAEVLRLRNRLLQQRRARVISERAYVNAEEKNERASILVEEMKTDLNILKKRLANELKAVRIDEEQSRQILLDHLVNQESWAQDRGDRRSNRKLQNVNNGLHRGEIIAAARSTRRNRGQGCVGIEGCDVSYTQDQQGQDNENESTSSTSRRAKRARLSNQGVGGLDESTKQRQ